MERMSKYQSSTTRENDNSSKERNDGRQRGERVKREMTTKTYQRGGGGKKGRRVRRLKRGSEGASQRSEGAF